MAEREAVEYKRSLMKCRRPDCEKDATGHDGMHCGEHAARVGGAQLVEPSTNYLKCPPQGSADVTVFLGAEQEHTTPAGDLLIHVAGIVNGARNKTHGDKERSFVGIAKAWKRLFDFPFKGSDVARAMVALKEQRIRHGEQNMQSLKEHVEDICGYWAIYYELRAKELER